MKALSFKQPWLWAITDLDKRIENRTWKPPRRIIGQRIVLHASKKDDDTGYEAIRRIAGFEAPSELPRGAIVATAKIVSWFDSGLRFIPEPGFDHLVDDKWFFGPVGWVLADVRNLPEPIPCRGELGFWDVPADVVKWIEDSNGRKSETSG